MARSAERRGLLQQPITRTEFINTFGRKIYDNYKWRWNSAARGERR